MKRRLTRVVITACVLAGLIWLALTTQQMGRVLDVVKSARFSLCIVAVLIAAAGVALSSTNIFLLLSPFGRPVSWGLVFQWDLLSLAGIYYTPAGSGGYAFLVYVLKKYGVDPEVSISCLILDKVVTVILAGCSLLALASIYFQAAVISVNPRSMAIAGCLVLALVAGLSASLAARRFSASVFRRLAFFRHHPWILLADVLNTGGLFFLGAMHFMIAFKAAGVQSPGFWRVLVSYGPLSLLSYLPFTIAGAGIGEAAAVAIWASERLRSEEVIAVFVLARLFSLISSLLLPGLVCAIRWRRFGTGLRNIVPCN